MISNTYNRYLWLLNTLLQFEQLSFEQICIKWDHSYISDGRPLTKRTFHLHRNAIQDMFQVSIKCNTENGYLYYIDDVASLSKDKARQYLLSSFTNAEIIGSMKGLDNRIIFEEVSNGTEFLQAIVEAMHKNCELNIVYQPFKEDASRRYHLQPYCMRIFKHRWYMLGFLKEKEVLRHFALDRIVGLEISDTKFNYPKDFNPEVFYADSFGMWVNKSLKPERVVIRTYGLQTKYLRSLPLHSSQQEIRSESEYSDFTLNICITDELINELLAKASSLEVIEPASLRKQIASEIQKMSSFYIIDEI